MKIIKYTYNINGYNKESYRMLNAEGELMVFMTHESLINGSHIKKNHFEFSSPMELLQLYKENKGSFNHRIGAQTAYDSDYTVLAVAQDGDFSKDYPEYFI